MSKQKFTPVHITSKEAMFGAVNDVVRAKLDHAALTVEMEQQIAGIQERFQKRLEPLQREIATKEAGIHVFATQQRETLFPKGFKSIDLQLAVIGFRETPYRVDKVRSKDTWDEIALRMAGYQETAATEEDGVDAVVTFKGEDFVRYGEPELDKKGLLTHRAEIPASALKAVGIRFDYDELFYIEPKSEVVDGSKEVAA